MSIDKSIHINVKGYYQHRNQNRKRIKWNSVLIKLHENSLHPNTELKNLLHDLERKKRVFRKERVFVIFLFSGVTGLRFLLNEFLKSFLKILEHFYKELCHQNFFINLQAKNYSNQPTATLKCQKNVEITSAVEFLFVETGYLRNSCLKWTLNSQ